jgi:hypothetical protein
MTGKLPRRVLSGYRQPRPHGDYRESVFDERQYSSYSSRLVQDRFSPLLGAEDPPRRISVYPVLATLLGEGLTHVR